MRLRLFAAAVLIGWALGSACASAAPDQTTAATELFSGITIVDGIQTQTWRNGGQFDCRYGVYGVHVGTCVPVEINGAARQFVNRGWLGQAEATAIGNAPVWTVAALSRGGFRRTIGHVMRWLDGFYVGAFIYPNERIIYGQWEFKH
jgi:hypothetical protein